LEEHFEWRFFRTETALGSRLDSFYIWQVNGFLRFIGVVNAAIWFGAALFFTVAVGPAIFSQEMHKVFGEAAFPYYSGAVALVLIKRYFILQNICGAIALLHLFAEWLYLGRVVTRFTLALLLTLFGLGLIGGYWIQPKMQDLRQAMYFGQTPELKEQARHTFGLWHGASQVANIVIIAGLLVYITRLTKPIESVRYGGVTKFRG
jgi:Domain of unknown function (DUF4149)